MGKFFLFLFLGIAFTNNIYALTFTFDGTKVEFAPIHEDALSQKGQSVALAIYDHTGAFIYYDKALFSKISDFAKFLILEHERAHHILGHTLSTKMHREVKAPVPHAHTFRKEKDADCFAGYRVAAVYPDKTPDDINRSIIEIYEILGGSSNQIPDWVRSRVNTIVTCFEGELLSEPEVWVAEVGE